MRFARSHEVADEKHEDHKWLQRDRETVRNERPALERDHECEEVEREGHDLPLVVFRLEQGQLNRFDLAQ